MRILPAVVGLVLVTAASAQPASLFEFSGLAPAYGVGDPVVFRAVNAVPLVVEFCNNVIQREGPDGIWADSDTLTCAEPPGPYEALAAGRSRQNVTLQQSLFGSILARGGTGRFRVVLGASTVDGRALPDSVRASPPFRVDGPPPEAIPRADSAARARLPDEAQAIYAVLPGFRAIAVGVDASGQTVWGYASRNPTAAGAVTRALAECTSRTGRSTTPCVLAAADGPAPD
jgi:hypothetical protein